MVRFEEEENNIRKIFKNVFLGVFAFIVLIILISSFYIIDEGERGVLLTFGKASDNVMNQGLHFKIPIVQEVVKFEVRTQKYEAEASASSKDLQIVTANIATNFHIDENRVIDVYKNLGKGYADRVIKPMEQEVVKSITAKYTAEELITKREDARVEMKNLLSERLSKDGIIITEVSITNFDFSQSFNDAIEQKVTAEQLKLKAERDLERIKVEAEQKVTQAQAEADSITIQSEALRQNQDVLQLRAIEKWNGVLPLVVGTDSTPFVNINK